MIEGKLTFRLLTEHSFFLCFCIKTLGASLRANRATSSADTQLTVSGSLEDLIRHFHRLRERRLMLFSVFQVTLSVCCLSPSKNENKQAAHPNMRTYYFCTDTAKEMESWMKVMTDAALVQAEPVKRFVPVLSRCQGKENILLESLNEEKQKLDVAPLKHFLVLILLCGS